MRHLHLLVRHDAGTVDLSTNDPDHLEAAATAFHAFAFAATENTEVTVPSGRGTTTTLKVGEIDAFILDWEA